MGSTALEICKTAYRQAAVGTELTSFSTSQAEPFNMALDLLNEVVPDINRQGDLYFTLADTTLAYTSGVYSYNLGELGIDPRRIQRVFRSAIQPGNVNRINWNRFQDLFRRSTIQENTPSYWAIFGSTLEFNCIQSQDFVIRISHYRDMPKVTAETDTLLMPERDEDVLRAGVIAYLTQRLGRSDAPEQWAIYEKKLKRFSLDVKKDVSASFVRPARF